MKHKKWMSAALCIALAGVSPSGTLLHAEETAALPEAVEETVVPEETDASSDKEIKSYTLSDGEYEPDGFSFTGGTGKLRITCGKVTVRDGQATAALTFDSGKIIYVKVNDVQYEPVSQTEDTSVYEIPVELNTNYSILACTTAMSEPHEIEYTLYISLGNEEDAFAEEDLVRMENAPEVTGFTYKGTVRNESAAYFRIHCYSGNVRLLEITLSDDETISWEAEDVESEDSLYSGEILRYLIMPEDTEIPAGLDEEMIVIRLPVASVCTDSETAAECLTDAEVTQTGDEWTEDSIFRTLLTNGTELAAVCADEAETIDSLREFGEGCALLGIPVLADRSGSEMSEEGQKEWAKVYSLFTSSAGPKTSGDREPKI